MNEKFSKCNTFMYKDEELINELVKDPRRSLSKIADKLNIYKQSIWRKIKKLEEKNVIWGYTAVVDDEKIGWRPFVILMKVRPQSNKEVILQIERIRKKIPEKIGIRVIDCIYTNGNYDCVNIFAAKNLARAREYYDSLRKIYKDVLEERPEFMEITFSLVRYGKINPEIEKLREFVSYIDIRK